MGSSFQHDVITTWREGDGGGPCVPLEAGGLVEDRDGLQGRP